MERFGSSCCIALVTSVLACASCDTTPGPRPAPSARATASGRASPVPAKKRRPEPIPLPPLKLAEPRLDLPVEGHGAAAVLVPVGATTSRPVLIALHGDEDTPQKHCDEWASVTRHPFILCPRGAAADTGGGKTYSFGSVDATKKELRAALASLKAKFGKHVGQAAVIAGFGRGADHAVPILLEDPAFFSRGLFVAGGYSAWSAGAATRFMAAGGQRVLWLCADSDCRESGRRNVAVSRGRGLGARLERAPKVARLDAAVARAIGEHWSWLVAGDPWWPSSSSDAGKPATDASVEPAPSAPLPARSAKP